MGTFQILRTGDPNKAPVAGSLPPGALAVEMASTPPRLWVGVPSGLDAAQQRLVVDSSLYVPQSSLPLSVANGGIPAGGTQWQVLGKVSAADRAVAWQDVGDRGDFSTSVGRFALTIVGSSNTAMGFGAAEQRTGNGNTAVGLGSLSLGAGDANVGIGTSTLVAASGNSNVAIGHSAGTYWGSTGTNPMTSANNCVYVGSGIRPSAATVINEVVIGSRVLGRGSNTITLGDDAITQLWCGGRDILANGALPAGGAQYQVLGKTSAADRAVAWQTVGDRGSGGTAIGDMAFGALTTGWANSAFGYVALGGADNATRFNTAIGSSALAGLAGSSRNNTALGYNAGYQFATGTLILANDCTYIGSSARAGINGPTNEIVIGANAVGRGSNTVTLGSDAITQLWCGGRDILAATSGAPFLPLTGGTLTTLTDATDGTSGVGLTITNNDTSFSRNAIMIDNQASTGIFIQNSGFGIGIDIRCSGEQAGLNILSGPGRAIFVRTSSTNADIPGIQVDTLQTTVGAAIRISNQSNVADSVGLDIRAATWATACHGVQINNTGTGSSVILQRIPPAPTPINSQLGDISFRGRRVLGTLRTGVPGASISAASTEAWNATANGTNIEFRVTPNGTVVPQTAMVIDHNRIVSVWDGTQMVTLPGGPDLPLSVANGGIPAGGTQYQVLGKTSAADRDAAWQTAGARPNNNTVVGAGFNLTATGGTNTVIGANAFADASTGNANVVCGVNAMRYSNAASSNVAIGTESLWAGYTVTNSCVVGTNAARNFTGGSNNVVIGHDAIRFLADGSTTLNSASAGIYIGAATRSGNATQAPTNEIVIGANAIGRGSNTVTLGTDAITALWCGGRDILAATAGGPFLSLAGGTLANDAAAATTLTVSATGTGSRAIYVNSPNGNAIVVDTTAPWGSQGILVNYSGSGDGTGMQIVNSSTGVFSAGLLIQNTNTGIGLSISAPASRGIQMDSTAGGTGITIAAGQAAGQGLSIGASGGAVGANFSVGSASTGITVSYPTGVTNMIGAAFLPAPESTGINVHLGRTDVIGINVFEEAGAANVTGMRITVAPINGTALDVRGNIVLDAAAIASLKAALGI